MEHMDNTTFVVASIILWTIVAVVYWRQKKEKR